MIYDPYNITLPPDRSEALRRALAEQLEFGAEGKTGNTLEEIFFDGLDKFTVRYFRPTGLIIVLCVICDTISRTRCVFIGKTTKMISHHQDTELIFGKLERAITLAPQPVALVLEVGQVCPQPA
jgi:hypothetical protein